MCWGRARHYLGGTGACRRAVEQAQGLSRHGVHAEGAERGWWLAESHWCRGCRAHTCRCSRPARLEAGRAASSSPKIACMRCLGSSKQQVCCQAIHAGVWSLQVPEVGAAQARHGGRVRGAGRGGRRAWFTLLEGQLSCYSFEDTVCNLRRHCKTKGHDRRQTCSSRAGWGG